MAKAQVKKKKSRVDMTAMCDVSFLLLTFFVMTSTARLPEPYPVDMPSSTVQTKIPDSNIATITVGEGVVFFGIAGKEERKIMLERMGEKYGITFTPEQTEAFSLIEVFGTDIRNLDQLIAMRGDERNKPGMQPGIPFDSLNNQLNDWVLSARLAAKQKSDSDLNIAIKGDAETQYPTIKRVISILQEQGKNNFFLVTNLRGDNF